MTNHHLRCEIDNIGKQIDTLKRDALARRRKLLQSRNIDVVLDVGANIGMYALELRKIGWEGSIVSFEPQEKAYRVLARKARKDNAWTTYPYALGSRNTSLKINVSGDSRASSLLPMLPAHLAIADYFKTVDTETVQVRKLDSIIDGCAGGTERIFLKIDAQGYEKRILAGAKRMMPRVKGLQLEMSLEPLYEGEASMEQMLRLTRRLGFHLMSMEYGVTNPNTGQMLQAEGIFFRDA